MPTVSKSVPTVKVIGSNGQISLGKRFAGRQVVVEEREPGVWLVRTATIVPDNEAWLDEKAMQDLQRALAWAQANPPQETNWNEFLKKMNDAD